MWLWRSPCLHGLQQSQENQDACEQRNDAAGHEEPPFQKPAFGSGAYRAEHSEGRDADRRGG